MPSLIEIPTIIYKDDDLLIVNKPPGLLSVEDGYDSSLPHLKTVLEPLHGELWMVHRLDKETSGILVLARNSLSHRKLNQIFIERKVEKKYHGLVTPIPEWRELEMNLPLQPNADRKHRTRANTKIGKHAQSYFRVNKKFSLGVLMEIEIFTGITHQIRAHLRVCDLALFGDKLYNIGLTTQPFAVPRVMLHARSLSFNHPSSGENLRFSAPYTDDFREAYTILKLTKDPNATL